MNRQRSATAPRLALTALVISFLLSGRGVSAFSPIGIDGYASRLVPVGSDPLQPLDGEFGRRAGGVSATLLFAGNGRPDRSKIKEDPNPGGLSNQPGSDDQGGYEDENLFDSIKNWFGSDVGKQDIQTYSISLFVALLIRTTIIEPRYIPSLSMYPTFDIGDQLAVEKVSKRIRPMERNQVVVFNPPQNFRDIMDANYGANSKKSKEALIKRIVAVAGDSVKVTGGKLYVNGNKQDEPFTAEDADYEFGPVEVPEGKVLVLGDNRNHSLDGHIWGFLPKENVIGRAVFVYWPPWRLGSEGMY